MPQDERGLYYPWYPTRYLLGRTRFLLTLPERSVYRDLLDMLYEAGGEVVYDPQYLCAFTGATEAQLDNVLNSGGFTIHDRRIRHSVVDVIIPEVVDAINNGRRGGIKSAEVRREKYGTAQPPPPSPEPPSNPPFEDPSEPPSKTPRTPPSKQKEGRKEEINKGTTPPAIVDNSERFARTPPGKVKPVVASDNQTQELTPERLAHLVDTCRSTTHLNQDRRRPWLTTQTGSWYARQPLAVQTAFEDAFIARYGFGIDTGPTDEASVT